MPTLCSLADKHCIPCQGAVPALEASQISQLLQILPGNWEVNAQGHLYKRFLFHDFMGAFNWAHQVAMIAEQEGHHPDLTISWGACAVEIWTHKINGLSESDFILAAKIEALP